MNSPRRWFVAIPLLAILCSSAHAGPIPPGVSLQDVNAVTALQATQNVLLAAGVASDQLLPVQILGTWSGTIDTAGWQLTYSGALNGVPLSLTQVGELDAINLVATWANTGTLSGDPISGSGRFDINTALARGGFLNWVEEEILNLHAVVLAGSQIVGVGIFFEYLQDGSAYIFELDRQLLDAAYGSDSLTTLGGTKEDLQSSGRSSSSATVAIDAQQVGTLDRATGTASITSSVLIVPEPSTLTLIGVVTLGGLYYGWRRRRRAAQAA